MYIKELFLKIFFIFSDKSSIKRIVINFIFIIVLSRCYSSHFIV